MSKDINLSSLPKRYQLTPKQQSLVMELIASKRVNDKFNLTQKLEKEREIKKLKREKTQLRKDRRNMTLGNNRGMTNKVMTLIESKSLTNKMFFNYLSSQIVND